MCACCTLQTVTFSGAGCILSLMSTPFLISSFSLWIRQIVFQGPAFCKAWCWTPQSLGKLYVERDGCTHRWVSHLCERWRAGRHWQECWMWTESRSPCPKVDGGTIRRGLSLISLPELIMVGWSSLKLDNNYGPWP